MSVSASTRQSLYFAYHSVVHRDALAGTCRDVMKEDDARVGHARVPARLRSILAHASERVPFYKEVANAIGAMPADDELSSHLAQFPILTKETIRAQGRRLLSDDIGQRRTYPNTSGGSTGEPIRLIQDQQYWDLTTAVQMAYAASLGRQFGEREVLIWADRRIFAANARLGAGRDDAASSPDPRGWRLNLVNRLSGRQLFNAFVMQPSKIERLLHDLDARPPRIIVSYAQAGYEVAHYARQRGIAVRPQRGFISTAEVLHDFMREEIEAVFGCPVYNRYGSREVGDIAGQCTELAALHVFPWSVYVEIVDDEGRPVPAGTPGNVLVTSLANFAMPLIRYAIGDRATLAPESTCGCGRQGQMLTGIHGRSMDMFRCEDGTLVDPEYIIELLYFRPWLRGFQVVQHTYNRVEFLFELRDEQPPNPSDLGEIEAGVTKVMGAACCVEFTVVTSIAKSPSGKYRYVVSKVPHPLGETP